MKSTLSKWGNSLAIRIPKSVAENLNIDVGSEVDISVNGNSLQIQPAKKKYHLDELLAGITDDNIHEEIDTGKPVGKELL